MKNEVEFKVIKVEDLKETSDDLICLSVDSYDKQFQVGQINVPTHNSEESKAISESVEACRLAIGSIARLGRAAGVHLVVCTQRPDVKIIEGETRANLTNRIGCGPLTSGASLMAFEDNSGMRIPSKNKGGVRIAIHGKGQMGQGFYSPTSDDGEDKDFLPNFFKPFGGYDNWLKQQNITENDKSAINNAIDEFQAENPVDTHDHLEDWDSDMDEIYESKKNTTKNTSDFGDLEIEEIEEDDEDM